MKPLRTSAENQPGFALIITVIILSLLAVMAVAFLSSSRLERGTARAVANKTTATLMAQSAVNTAIARLIDNITTSPDSATAWEVVNDSSGNVQYQGTTLYYREQVPEATSSGPPSPLHAWPLISGAEAIAIPNPPQSASSREATLRTALPVFDDTNSFDLNHARFSGDTQGWIGAPTGVTARPPFRALWVNVTNSDNKIGGRYAYWMEDESFKVNVNLMGNTLRNNDTLGNVPSNIPLQGLLATVGLSIGIADTIYNYRANFPSSQFFEYRALNQVSGQPTLADTIKFGATIYSAAMNVSRSGSKRVNLNKVVTTSNDATEIRKQVSEIVNATAYHLPDFGERFYRTGPVPSGSPASVLDAHQVATADRTIYLNKIAANIRDYIDSDSQPTILNNDPPNYSVRIGTQPTNALGAIGGNSGPNEVIAIGKENVPLLEEYALRITLTKFTPAGYVPVDPNNPQASNPGADYEFYSDYYFEFWNMTTKDIKVADLGPNPYIFVANQCGWDARGGQRSTQSYISPTTDIPSDPLRDFKIPLNKIPNLVFKAGSPTVITTDPNNFPALVPNANLVFVATQLDPKSSAAPPGSDNYRRYAGKTFLDSSSAPTGFPSKARALRINIKPRSTSQTDYETEVVIANDNGILESFEALPIAANISVNNDTGDRINSQNYFPRGGSLRGNSGGLSSWSQTGDPRTNNEQLSVSVYDPTLSADQTRYFDSGLNNNVVANSKASLTQLNSAPPGNFVIYSSWADPLPTPAPSPPPSGYMGDAAHAPAVIANAHMDSIGELGQVFDPVRGKTTPGGSNNINYSRGGGRTLKIGQPERYDSSTNLSGLWDGDTSSPSREWTAWRLTDIFSTSDAVQLEGRININGVNRDHIENDPTHPGGAALRAALYGYKFQVSPDSDPNLAGSDFDADPSNSSDKINELVRQVQARLANDPTAYNKIFKTTSGPFAERGELSELPIFNTGTDLAAGVDTATAYDRGREELFRRLIELTTTRGSIFTVYAVGQSLLPKPASATPLVLATSQMKVTFRIDPVWNGGTPSDPFDPTISGRFKKPDGYAIKVLYAGE